MFTIDQEMAQSIRSVTRADRFASLMIRRHQVGRADDTTSIRLAWTEKTTLGDSIPADAFFYPDGSISIQDYRSNKLSITNGYVSVTSETLQGLGRVIQADDRAVVTVTLYDGYGTAQLDVVRRGRGPDKIIWSGFVDAGPISRFVDSLAVGATTTQ